MSDVQRFGQVIAISILSFGPIAAAALWVNHVINDSTSEAGTLAVNSVLAILGAALFVGAATILVALIVFWVWVFGIAWSSKEAREA